MTNKEETMDNILARNAAEEQGKHKNITYDQILLGNNERQNCTITIKYEQWTQCTNK